MPELLLKRLKSALADRYEVESELGQGGMATVYLARDLKHDRQVAIKMLRPELAAVLGAERFVQEITTTAHLQHPNILPLFDSGEAEGFLYYVMPYVEGESLREKLNREKQLGIEEAVRLTTEVADALEYAHQQGVIHRDIKPENILLHAGRPLVADFGIALAVSAAAGGRMTETGLSLGTPHYMSPEQATAEKDLTHRTDIYSLGAVLYEMLTGDPPHTGSSAQQIILQQIILKIVTDAVRPVAEARKSVPSNVAAAVAKALEKLPADRFETAAQFAEALTNPAFAVSTAGARDAAAAGADWRQRFFVPLAAVAAVAVLGGVWGWLRGPPHGPVERHPVTLTNRGSVSGLELSTEVTIAPDGSMLVYRDTRDGRSQLYLKRRDALDAQPLANTEDASGPFFSPDGEWIAFFAGGQLRKRPTSGGGAVALADSVAPAPLVSGTWLDDGTIVFVDRWSQLRRVHAAGGPADVLVPSKSLPGGPMFLGPLPGERGMLYTLCSGTGCSGYAYDAREDTVRLLVENAVGVWYAPTGHILYADRETLFAAPWDQDGLRLDGPPVTIVAGFQAPGLAFSNDGTALYVLGPPKVPLETGEAEAVWVDRAGRVQQVDPDWRFNTGRDPWAWTVHLSPDGQRLVIPLATGLGLNIWVKQLPAGPLSPDLFRALRSEPALDAGRPGHHVHLEPADGSGYGDVPRRLQRVDAGGGRHGRARAPLGCCATAHRGRVEPRRPVARPAHRRTGGHWRARYSDGAPRTGQRPPFPARHQLRRAGPGAFPRRSMAGIRIQRDRWG